MVSPDSLPRPLSVVIGDLIGSVKTVRGLRKETRYSRRRFPFGQIGDYPGSPDDPLLRRLSNEEERVRRFAEWVVSQPYTVAIESHGVRPQQLRSAILRYVKYPFEPEGEPFLKYLSVNGRDVFPFDGTTERRWSSGPLRRLQRLKVRLAAAPPADVPSRVEAVASAKLRQGDTGGIGKTTDTEWMDVQARLLEKRERGRPYTSVRKLARELGCANATIQKAIADSDALKGWKARSTSSKAAPKATGLGAVERGNARQSREPAPDDVLPDDDVDATMARLIEQAKPDERAKLNALDKAERRELVVAYNAQKRDDEPSPLEPGQPGGTPRKVKHHKRA